jgi:hypothetical protein
MIFSKNQHLVRAKTVLIYSLFLFVYGLVSCYSTYYFCENRNKEERNQILKQNLQIINSISMVATTQSAVTDMLMRISHYTENHEEGGNHMCPECSGTGFVFDEIEDDETTHLEPTHENVMKDLRDIERGIDSFVFGHLLQVKKLQYVIKKEKEKKWQENFFGGVELPPTPAVE